MVLVELLKVGLELGFIPLSVLLEDLHHGSRELPYLLLFKHVVLVGVDVCKEFVCSLGDLCLCQRFLTLIHHRHAFVVDLHAVFDACAVVIVVPHLVPDLIDDGTICSRSVCGASVIGLAIEHKSRA